MIIDVSRPISEQMLTWPGDPPVLVMHRQRRARGDVANVSEIVIGSHAGTHVDPPSHFIDGGASVDLLDLDVLVGPAVLADLRGIAHEIDAPHLEALDLPAGTKRLLLYTDASTVWTDGWHARPDALPSLSIHGARWLVERGVVLVGIDSLSIERANDGRYPVHEALLRAGVVIVEGLTFRGVEPGRYGFACLPLRLLDGDGAPARAVLITEGV